MKFLRLYLVIVLCLIAHLTVNSQSVYRLVDTAIGLPDDEVKGFSMRQMAGWESVHLPDFHFLMAALFVCFRPWVPSLIR